MPKHVRKVVTVDRLGKTRTYTNTADDNPFEIEWTRETASIQFFLDDVEVGTVYYNLEESNDQL